MALSYDDLPEDVWELIVNRLDGNHQSDLESLSIVSKRFLSLTNRLRIRFNVVDQTCFIHGTISRFIDRFKHLKTLDLSKLSRGNLETALNEIARSSVALSLEALDLSNHECVPIKSLKKLGLSDRKLKVLKCANVGRLCDKDLVAIAKFHPDLVELDISYPRYKTMYFALGNSNLSKFMVTDEGIEVLSSRLKNLTKIDMSRNNLLTDKSILDLSSNCLRLQEILFIDCSLITMKGVRFMLHNSLNLRSVSLRDVTNPDSAPSLFVNPATSSRGLSSLHFRDMVVSDQFLKSIVEARLPLKGVSFSCCVGYTIDGISNLLQVYRSLEFLEITKDYTLTDHSIMGLSLYLHDLVSIRLNVCCKLTSVALLTLINNCPFLESIEMKYSKLGWEEDKGRIMDVMKKIKKPNSRIKSLNLEGNVRMTDECLVKVTSFCPNLKTLDLKFCLGISTEAIVETLKGCSEISYLDIQHCGKVRNLGLKMEVPLKLEKLFMGMSGVNDEGLMEIVKRCNGLVKVDMAGCVNVTTSTVKFMVRNCEKLREIDLNGCLICEFTVDWMVFARPSLKKMIPPSYDVTTESQRQILLRHGCLVLEKHVLS